MVVTRIGVTSKKYTSNYRINYMFLWYGDPFLSPSLTLNVTQGNLVPSYICELHASCAESHWLKFILVWTYLLSFVIISLLCSLCCSMSLTPWATAYLKNTCTPASIIHSLSIPTHRVLGFDAGASIHLVRGPGRVTSLSHNWRTHSTQSYVSQKAQQKIITRDINTNKTLQEFYCLRI